MSQVSPHPLVDNIQREHPFEPLRLEGELPGDLRGTLYRNGPGIFSLMGERYRHLFDGDGLITACRLGGGRCLGAVRLIMSHGLAQELAAQRPLFDTFGTRRRGRWAGLRKAGHKNTANTSLLAWRGQLLALMEGGLPTRLDARDLSTLGETDLGGLLGQTFAAHPHRVPAHRTVYTFGMTYGRRPALTLYALPDRGEARRLTQIPMRQLGFVHDFMVTESHAIFFVPPMALGLWDYYVGGRALADCLQWRPARGSEVIVVELAAPHRVRRFDTEAFFQYHFVNAWQRGRDIWVDFIRLDDYSDAASTREAEAATAHGGPARTSYVRAHIDLQRPRVTLSTFTCEPSVELPGLNPRSSAAPHRWAWMATFSGRHAGSASLADGLGRLETETGRMQALNLGAQARPSEPVFVARAAAVDEADGYLLSVVYDERRHCSHLAVMDAAQPERPPLCRAFFDQPLPTSFHGIFVADEAAA